MVLLLAVPATASRTASDPALGGAVAAACGLASAHTTVTIRGLSRREPDGFARAIAAVILGRSLAACLLPCRSAGGGPRRGLAAGRLSGRVSWGLR
jgi:hypothetical protein